MRIAFAGLRSFAIIAAASLFGMAESVRADTSPFDARQAADEQEMLAKARKEASERGRANRSLQGTVTIGPPQTSTGDSAEAKVREAELQRLSDKLRRASQMRATRATTPSVDTPWRTEVTETDAAKPDYRRHERSALGHKAAAEAIRVRDEDERVAVLMVMTPGDRGIRRFDRTADPILCTKDGCYISRGGATAAQFISLRRSFGMANTLGARAGTCRHSTACVFRGIDISGANAVLQPVDLKVLVHDRREMKAAAADDSCTVDGGRLSCEQPIRGDGYTLWVVPEAVAARAGSEGLQRAVDAGLPDPTRRAALGR